MDDALFEHLLNEDEGPSLDFKKQQYRFVKATDDEKSELLKDILGFVNAWRRDTAYILIGVEQILGARANVVGIPASEHLQDHAVQQFVNSLTNQPVLFRCETYDYRGKQIGIIGIELQQRPVYLNRDFGKLKAQEVYVRRGSSTNPQMPARPDEIASMRVASAEPPPSIAVVFSGIERDETLGEEISIEADDYELPVDEELSEADAQHAAKNRGFMVSPYGGPNEHFFSDLADFVRVQGLVRPVRLTVRNVGLVAAKDVRIELTGRVSDGIVLAEKSDLPRRPEPRENRYSYLERIQPAFRPTPGDVTVEKDDEQRVAIIDCGDLQPGRRIRSEIFYVGSKITQDVVLSGVVIAANLPKPQQIRLTLRFTLTEVTVTMAELRELAKTPEAE